MAVRRIPWRKLLRRVSWAHVAVHAVHAVHSVHIVHTVHAVHTIHAVHTVHVRWVAHVRRRAHVGRAGVVGIFLLSPGWRNRWLPMGHSGHVVVHLDKGSRDEYCLHQVITRVATIMAMRSENQDEPIADSSRGIMQPF